MRAPSRGRQGRCSVSAPVLRTVLSSGGAAVGLFPHMWPHCQGREGLGSGPCGHPGEDLRSRLHPLRLVPMGTSETWFLLPLSAPYPQTLTSATQPRVVTRGIAEGAGDEDWTGAPRAVAQGHGVTERFSAHPPTRKAPHSPRAPLDLPSEPPLIPGISTSLSRAEVGWGEEMKQGEEGVLPTRAAWKAAAAGSGGG